MHVLRFFLTRPSAATLGCAPARRRIRVLTLPKQPSLRPSDPHSLPGFLRPSQPSLSLLSARALTLDCCIPNCRSNPIAHRVRRKHQRLPPSLLIENASDQFPSTRKFLPEAFPITDAKSSTAGAVRDVSCLVSKPQSDEQNLRPRGV